MLDESIQKADDELIVEDVARAIEEEELVAYYQPIIDTSNGMVVGAEALVRWTMPDGTVIPAGAFVPSLERTDTIIGLDWVMAEQVCSFLQNALGTAALVPISINFSPRHASDPSFPNNLAATADWHEVTHDFVRVEFNEALIWAEDGALEPIIAETNALDFVVSADNFATGEEGLRRAAANGIHVIKVAGAWWREQDDETLARFASLAEELGILLSAEAVETEAELVRLCNAGFPRAQGFYIGKPMSAEAFSAYCIAAYQF